MLNDGSIISTALTIIIGAFFSYGAYWAFTIRKALMAHLYRNQALWVGAGAVYFVALSAFITLALLFNASGVVVNLLAAAFIILGFVVIFDWIDSTVRVARRSDPLLRDTLHWSKLRYFIGITSTIGLFFNVVFNVIFTNSSFILLGTPALLGYVGTVLFLGALALLLSARRSGDLTLRRHLKWFGLGAALLWLSGQISSPWARITGDSFLTPIVTYSLFAIAAYCLYRSAKSLVPLGRITIPELVPSTQ